MSNLNFDQNLYQTKKAVGAIPPAFLNLSLETLIIFSSNFNASFPKGHYDYLGKIMIVGELSAMLTKCKTILSHQWMKWFGRFLYYLLILLLLFFMYGFNDASAGSYIYNDF